MSEHSSVVCDILLRPPPQPNAARKPVFTCQAMLPAHPAALHSLPGLHSLRPEEKIPFGVTSERLALLLLQQPLPRLQCFPPRHAVKPLWVRFLLDEAINGKEPMLLLD